MCFLITCFKSDCVHYWFVNKEVGFSIAITREHERNGTVYHRLNIPENTAESLGLERGDLVRLNIRNMEGETVVESRKVKGKKQKNVYLPRGVSNELGLDVGDLVDVFAEKKQV